MNHDKLMKMYDLYSENVYRLALSYTGCVADAEDIVHNVFLKVFEKHIDIDAGKEKSYLLTVTANMCRNHLRSARVKRSVSYEESEHENVNASFDDEEADLYEAMGRLPEKYRVVLYLHYYEGYTFREIARLLHITSSAVSMRLHRGREMLRAELKDYI